MWRDNWNRLRLLWELNTGHRRKEMSTVMSHLKRSLRPAPEYVLTDREHAWVDRIQAQTAEANRNNLTRTAAYLDFYCRYPEVHWSLLAHAVSRNGGWNMTDLKGDWLTRLDSDQGRTKLYEILERANWLIFHDAYPQLMLYARSKQVNSNLSHLLPAFGVSKFMWVMWDLFWTAQDSSLLTRGFVINEQNYIESRVVQNEAYAPTLSSIKLQLQSLLNLNQVLLPYRRGSDVRLAGTTMEQFGSVDDRIQTGLRLYKNLFQDKLLHEAMVRWACDVVHTGSRSDYWPDIFTPRQAVSFDDNYQPRFIGQNQHHCGIFSPVLMQVWPDVDHRSAEPGDWFHDFRHTIYLFDDVAKQPTDFTDQYIDSIRTIENIIAVKQKAEVVIPRI